MSTAPVLLAAADIFTEAAGPPLSLPDLRRRLGYRAEADIPQPVREQAQVCLADLLEHLRDASAGYLLCSHEQIEVRVDSILIGDAVLSCGAAIAERFKGCHSLALFVATTGGAFQRRLDETASAGDPLAHFLLDAAGSTLAERCAAAVHARVRAFAGDAGWCVTNRYSPGYGAWSVSDQQVLFSLVPHAFCGVALTPGALMIPVKSVSGIIGIGPSAVFVEHDCPGCESRECSEA